MVPFLKPSEPLQDGRQPPQEVLARVVESLQTNFDQGVDDHQVLRVDHVFHGGDPAFHQEEILERFGVQVGLVRIAHALFDRGGHGNDEHEIVQLHFVGTSVQSSERVFHKVVDPMST